MLMLLVALSEMASLGSIVPFLSALSNAEQVLKQAWLQPLLSLFDITSTSELVFGLAIAFIGITLATNLLRITTLYCQTHLSARIGIDLAYLIYHRTILQPYRFYLTHNSSDLISLVAYDANGLGAGIVMPCLLAVTNSFVIIGLVIGLFWIDGRVAVSICGILGAVYGVLYIWRRQTLLHNSRLMSRHHQQRVQVIQESLGGIREVILDETHGFFQSIYAESNRINQLANASNMITYLTPRYGIEMVAMSAIALMALSLGQDGDFRQAIPVLGSLAVGANRLLPTLQQSFVAIAGLQGSRASLQRSLMALERAVNPLQFLPPPPPIELKQELRFEQVWFRYHPDEAWILQNLNLVIPSRTTVGFVGTTGSGKTTTADLILGLLQPERGQILLDNEPLSGERLRAWQGAIAHVPQHIFLSDATIASNIAFGIPTAEIDLKRVMAAAQSAQLDDFIQTLPQGYQTWVGERGVRLSGGQRQRVGIARALYSQASVIVFDEATSALDTRTEQDVMAAIEGLSHDLTIILITHRLTTVEKCDRIFELQQGRIVHQGTFKELTAQSASFRDYLSAL
ncbi:MAG: ABC transporter ATP-binding protein [Spirulina sp. SIO3F2]|nr:ABC transporter ATP-binding protein [Spirulina sp. SIO3F2]